MSTLPIIEAPGEPPRRAASIDLLELSRRRAKAVDPKKVRLLPTSRAEMQARGWDAVDVVFVSGDAYVDHPSFAMALLGRVLEADSWFANRLVDTLGRLREADDRHLVAALLRNLTTEDRRGARSRFPLRTLKDVIADASRPDPTQTDAYTPDDYREVVQRVRDYMKDELHGFQRIVDVTRSRLP